ncbi:hypothetical protein V6N12_007258 [Hibiscus sabdariffa]|uniref:BED-type domain-containing protein n=1 Tax=Hibiscus sabdariffa TaxID=183260 RepID=A0ABR2F189_9ROSI
MSDGSCSDPFRFHDDQYLDNYSPLESTGFELSANTPTMENIKNPKDIVITTDDVEVVAAVSGGAEQVDVANNEEQAPFTKRKRKKTSGVWEHFHLVKLSDGTEVFECIHCGEKIKKLKDGTTTLLHRHIGDCPKLKAVNRVDNAKTNDVVARKLMEILNIQNKLVVGGTLFHVQCCAHILNLLVHDGLGEIEDIIHNVCESVKHVNASPSRLHIFSELAKQPSMPKKILILDITTRWNATYAMLSIAMEFKEVFVNYVDRESTYTTLPSEEDWKKLKRCSKYPTSNLFLSELFGIKEALDTVVLDVSDYMMAMAMKMKRKFDKYKMKLLEFSFNSIYSPDEAPRQMKIVRDTLYELYQEYIEAHKATHIVSSTEAGGKEGVYIGEPGVYFDALGWWEENNLKFRILSKMTVDILEISVTNVASESAFSPGGRVIDPHRSSLGTKMVDMLICGVDWYHQHYGLEKNKNEPPSLTFQVLLDVGIISLKHFDALNKGGVARCWN